MIPEKSRIVEKRRTFACRRSCLTIVGICVGFQVGCVSDPIQKGTDYYSKGYCSIAVLEWLPEAQSGSPAAQNNMGLIWRQGCPDLSIPIDDTEAYNWFVLAAQNGEPVAMLNLGDMHRDGMGTAQNLEKAQVWYKLAARRGNSAAQSRLAAMGIDAPPIDFPVVQAPKSDMGGSTLSDWLQVFGAALLIGSSSEYQSLGSSYPNNSMNVEFQANCYTTASSVYEGQATVRTTCR